MSKADRPIFTNDRFLAIYFIYYFKMVLQSPVSRQDSFEDGKCAPIATPERSKSSSGETLEKIKEEIEVVKAADENPCTTESSTTSSLPPTSTILTTTSRLIL